MFENQIPAPPVDMVMPAYNTMIASSNFVVLGLVTIWSLYESRRTQTLLPLMIMIGAALSAFEEPIFDIVGAVWYPEHGQTPFFRAFNVSISMWLIPAYGWYIGGLGNLMYRKIGAGLTMSQLVMYYFLFWGANLALELPGLNLGIYQYYGDQPFKLFGFPLWMAMTNSVMPILGGALFNLYKDVLTGPRVLLTIPLMTMVTGIPQVAIGWPTWLALNYGGGMAATHVGALLSLGLSFTAVYLIGSKVCVPAKATAAVPTYGKLSAGE